MTQQDDTQEGGRCQVQEPVAFATGLSERDTARGFMPYAKTRGVCHWVSDTTRRARRQVTRRDAQESQRHCTARKKAIGTTRHTRRPQARHDTQEGHRDDTTSKEDHEGAKSKNPSRLQLGSVDKTPRVGSCRMQGPVAFATGPMMRRDAQETNHVRSLVDRVDKLPCLSVFVHRAAQSRAVTRAQCFGRW
jgi:hypothetical protein